MRPQWTFTCSNLTIETLEQGVKYVQSCEICSGVFTVNFEHISPLILVFLLLTLSRYMSTGTATTYYHGTIQCYEK